MKKAVLKTSDVVPPLHMTTTYYRSEDPTVDGGYVYSRNNNPNLNLVEQELSLVLGGEAVTYTTGMAAIVALLLHLKARRIFMVPGYFGTTCAVKMLSQLSHIEIVSLPRPSSISNQQPYTKPIIQHVTTGDILWLETPLNPTGEILDLDDYSQLVFDLTHSQLEHHSLLIKICDATLSPPPLFFPLKAGFEYVIYSAAKLLGGHSDLMGGVITTKLNSSAQQLRDQRVILGSVMGNLEAWLLSRSLKTLELRAWQQSHTTFDFVSWLVTSNEIPPGIIQQVIHSSLSSPNLSGEAYKGHAPTFAIIFSSQQHAKSAPTLLKVFHNATSLGSCHSFIEWRHQFDTSLDPRLCRISIGLENLSRLKSDFIQMSHQLFKRNNLVEVSPHL